MRLISLTVAALTLMAFGCESAAPIADSPTLERRNHVDASTIADRDPRGLMVFDGRSGEAIDWRTMIARMDGADVIILGEQHDDAVGHATQLAIVQDVAMRRGSGGALAMEMLERDEQLIVDDFADGLIDKATFAKLTDSESWAGEKSWANWYQPIIDAAHDANWRIVAANAPRRYVRLARTEGYEMLDDLPKARRALFDLPRTWPLDYRQRFVDVMSGNRDDDEEEEQKKESDESSGDAKPQAEASAPAHGPMKPEDIDSSLRSQLLWDATMADSIARARRGGSKPVIHLIGQFHSDFNGGTVQEVRARLGRGVKIITVSMQRRERDTMHDRDRHRADFVIYTGRKPPKPPKTPDDAAE